MGNSRWMAAAVAGWFLVGGVSAFAQDVELTICRPGYPERAKAFLEKALGEFQKTNPGVKFKIVDADWETFQSRIMVWVAGQQEPDIYVSPMQQFVDLAELGAYLPLDQYLDPALKADIPESLWWDMSRFTGGKGKYLSVAAAASTYTLWYNKKILAQAGLTRPPKNWDELVRFGKQIVERTKLPAIGMNAGRPFDTTQLLFGMLYFSGTNRPFVDTQGRAIINSPDAVKAVQFWVDLYQKHKITNSSPEQTSKGDLRLLFQQGKLAMHIDNPGLLPTLAKITDLRSPETSTFLIGGPFQPSLSGHRAMNSTDAQQWVISAHTKHPDLAWKVLRYLLEPRWQNEHDRIQGGAPFRASILKSMPIDYAWILKPNAEEASNGLLFSPLIPRSGQFFQVLNKHLVEALLGQAPVKDALDRAAAEVNKLAGL